MYCRQLKVIPNKQPWSLQFFLPCRHIIYHTMSWDATEQDLPATVKCLCNGTIIPIIKAQYKAQIDMTREARGGEDTMKAAERQRIKDGLRRELVQEMKEEMKEAEHLLEEYAHIAGGAHKQYAILNVLKLMKGELAYWKWHKQAKRNHKWVEVGIKNE